MSASKLSLASTTKEPTIRQLEKEISRLQKLAYYDFLTKIPNRRGFINASEPILQTVIAARQHRTRRNDGRNYLCLAMFDVDDFKQYNDRFSYAYGDNCLKAIVIFFQKYIRKTDILGRWGGDEFVVLFPNSRAAFIQKRILHLTSSFYREVPQTLAQLNHRQLASPVPITISIGLVDWHQETNLNALVKRANIALQKAKVKKNQLVWEKFKTNK